jgi:hypothetical protein
MPMADLNVLRQKINDVSHTVSGLDATPRGPGEIANSVKEAKQALGKIVEILQDIVTFLGSKHE